MIKKIVASFIVFFSFSVFAVCPDALETDNPGFCASFQTSASCYCAESAPIPSIMCRSMDTIYSLMTKTYGSLQAACLSQRHTDPQTCVDDWNCYRNGGVDSQGKLCSFDTHACQ